MAQPQRESAAMNASQAPRFVPVSAIARDNDLYRELLGITLVLGAVFVAAALVFGAGAPGKSCWAATATFGPVGACGRALVLRAIGPFAAAFVPIVLALYAIRALGCIEISAERRWRLFSLGLMVLVATGSALARGAVPGVTGAARRPDLLGGSLSWALAALFGFAGAWMVLALGLFALMAATLAQNPIRLFMARASKGWKEIYSVRPDDRRAQERVETPEREKLPPRKERRIRTHEAAVAAAIESAAREAGGDELPPLDLLAPATEHVGALNTAMLDVIGYRLTGVLRTLKLDGQLVGRTTGAAITRFEVQPAPAMKLAAFATLGHDIALAMKLPSVRVLAPIPGKGSVGIEVPNPSAEVVHFREVLESSDFHTTPRALPIVLGRDLDGKAVVADLTKLPHLLVAGATGSGKSTCMSALLASLIFRHAPRTLQFLLVGRKNSGLCAFEALPHLRHPIVSGGRDAAAVLAWAVTEMHERYRLLAERGGRNIQDFNARLRDSPPLPTSSASGTRVERRYDTRTLPYIVLVIEELAELMLEGTSEVEAPLVLLAQKARAVGIHLVLATRQPSERVITGLMRASFPSRIALRVEDASESRSIIDGAGAESLVGDGDMLFIPPGKSEPVRLQGAFLSADDAASLTRWHAEGRIAYERASQLHARTWVEPSASETSLPMKVRAASPAAA